MKRLVIAAAILTSALLLGAGDPPAKEVGPLFELSGSYSDVKKPSIEVIGDEARWQQVWKDHKGDKLEMDATDRPVIPYVDFSRCMVVAMFSGTTINGSGWHVISTQDLADHTLIRYDRMGFQSESSGGDTSKFNTTDYGFAVLPRSSLPLVLEENIQTMIDAGPVWKERQRLPALPKPATAPGPKPFR